MHRRIDSLSQRARHAGRSLIGAARTPRGAAAVLLAAVVVVAAVVVADDGLRSELRSAVEEGSSGLSLSASGYGSFTVRKAGTAKGLVQGLTDYAITTYTCGYDKTECFWGGFKATLHLLAYPEAGKSFGGWQGATGCGLDQQCSVTISSDMIVTAAFNGGTPVQVTVVGKGVVLSVPTGLGCGHPGGVCTAEFPAGSTVKLEAKPDTGQVFIGWTGAAGCGTDAKCSLAVSSSKATVTAGFAAPTPSPTPTPTPTPALTARPTASPTPTPARSTPSPSPTR